MYNSINIIVINQLTKQITQNYIGLKGTYRMSKLQLQIYKFYTQIFV